MIKKKFAVRRRIHTHNPCMVIIIPYTHATWNQPPMSAYSVRTTTYFKNRYSSTAHSFRSESQTNRANPTTTTFQHPTNYKDSKMNYYWLKKFSVIVFRIYDRHNKNRVDKKKKKNCCVVSQLAWTVTASKKRSKMDPKRWRRRENCDDCMLRVKAYLLGSRLWRRLKLKCAMFGCVGAKMKREKD